MAIGTAIVVGVAVVSGLVQAYNSHKTRGANKSELQKIEKLFNKVKPPNYDLSIIDPPELHNERLAMPEFSPNNPEAQWDLSKLEPRDLQQIEKFNPQVGQLIKEKAPELIKETEDTKMGRDAQRNAMQRFMDISEGGYDPQHAQRVQDARQRAQSEAQSRSESTMQDFERRGIGGSGLELASKIGSSAQAMDRNAMMGLQAESDAYRNQLNALSQGASLGRDLRGQDVDIQSKNARIINDFNQRMSKRHQDWEMNRANAINQADLQNIQEAQRISDFNTKSKNTADVNQQSRMDDITQRQYQEKLDKLRRMDDLSKWKYGAEGKERGYMDNAAILNSKWKQGERDWSNDMKSQAYNDQLKKLSGQAGIGKDYITQRTEGTQDTNEAIQGITNVATSYGMEQNSNEQRQKDRDAFADMNNPYRKNPRQGSNWDYKDYGGMA